MSDPVLQLAAAIQAAPVKDGSPAERLADALLEANRDALYWATKYSALYAKFNAAIHERDELREKMGRAVRDARQPPALQVFCDEPDCDTLPLTRAVAPPDEAIGGWVRGMGWSSDGVAHRCPRHGGAK